VSAVPVSFAADAADAAAAAAAAADGNHGPVSYLSKLIIKPVNLGFPKLRSSLTNYVVHSFDPCEI
jgi:hypothetical protein